MDDDLLDRLDEAWDEETGFLGKLRSGEIDLDAGEDYVSLLSMIPPIGDVVEARLVKLIWFAPMFIEWQIERAAKDKDDVRRLRRIATQVHESVSNVLGVP